MVEAPSLSYCIRFVRVCPEPDPVPDASEGTDYPVGGARLGLGFFRARGPEPRQDGVRHAGSGGRSSRSRGPTGRPSASWGSAAVSMRVAAGRRSRSSARRNGTTRQRSPPWVQVVVMDSSRASGSLLVLDPALRVKPCSRRALGIAWPSPGQKPRRGHRTGQMVRLQDPAASRIRTNLD